MELATGDDDFLDLGDLDEDEEQPETIDCDNHREGHDTRNGEGLRVRG